MSQHTLFDITPEHIADLDDERLRLLIARLCQADLRCRGLPLSAVLYGGNQIAADGGIDVRVELPADTEIRGFIPKPHTGFQAKADDMPAGKIAKEMRLLGQSGDSPPGLRPSIRALADQSGAYVIVSSKGSTTDSALAARRQAMRDAVADLPSPNDLQTDFYDRTRMADWVNEYPGEVLWVRAQLGQSLPGWLPHGNWSHAPEDSDDSYIIDETARLSDQTHPQGGLLSVIEGITRLRARLASPGGIVRLTGLSGTGKTRLLEALFDSRIGNQPLDPALAIYADVGHERPEPSTSQLAVQLNAERRRAILLLDNCPRGTHDAIAPKCSSPSGYLSLITVDLDIRDEKLEGTDVFRLQTASEGVMRELLERRFPALPQIVSQRIAQFSDGNARIALLIADSAQNGPQDVNLTDLADESLFQRLFHQRRGENDDLLRAAEILALVYSFDGETAQGDLAELPVLARIGGLDMRVLQRTVAELSRRDIIQSRGQWRAILPQPLANWLAQRALANLPALEIADAFWQHSRLRKSFAHRLSYLHDSPEAQRIAKAWLTRDGPLSNLHRIVNSYNDLRMDLVAFLAPVLPAAVLDLIAQVAMDCEPEELRSGQLHQRHRLMTLLRKLAWFPEHFRRAALILARFVQAELVENTSTQDSRYLEELFWPVLSGTAAGPRERIAVLEELLSAPDQAARDTGLVALRGMLRSRQLYSSHDFSFGGRPVDDGWRPRNTADCEEWFGGALAIARCLALSDSPEKAAARSMLADTFRELWSVGCVHDQLEQTASSVGEADYWPEGWLAVRRTLAIDAKRLEAKRMEASLITRLESLRERLAPVGVEGRLRSYVLIPAHEFSRLALWEDGEETAGKPGNREQGDQPIVGRHQEIMEALVEEARELGRQCAQDSAPFERCWPELFGPSAYQAHWFGQGLAWGASNIDACWADLRERFSGCDPDKRNVALLCGFLEGAAAAHRPSVDRFLDDAMSDRDLGPVFPHLQMAVGVDQAGIRRLLAALEVGLSPSRNYLTLAYNRQVIEGVPPTELGRLLLTLAEQAEGYDVAVEILSMYFGSSPEDDQLPWDSTLLDCGRQLLLGYPLEDAKQNVDYKLRKIAELCLTGSHMASDAQALCERVRDTARDWRRNLQELDELVECLLELHPHVALNCWLEDDAKHWANVVDQFVGTYRNPLGKVPPAILLQWAEQEPETGYLRLAAVVPLFDRDEETGASGWSEIALALLESAPDRQSVFQTLVIERIRPNSWSGSLTAILEQRCSLVSQFLEDSDPGIRQSTQRLDRDLRTEIEQERTREHIRDERFE